jgi:transcriptional regulator with PAS, ATPase and Fis domain
LLLAEHFLRLNLQSRRREYTGFTPAGVRFLLAHSWPGNVRELRNAIEGACAFLIPGKPVDAEDLQLVVHRDRTKALVPPLGTGCPNRPKGLCE